MVLPAGGAEKAGTLASVPVVKSETSTFPWQNPGRPSSTASRDDCYGTDPAGERFVFDPPDGQWAKPPVFPSGAAGLVSTVDDLHAFARMLLSGGWLADGSRLLSRASIDAMTTDQIDVASGAPGPRPDGSEGWSFGVGVQVRRTGLAPTIGSYGWAGCMGSMWSNDPSNTLVGVMLSTDVFGGPFPQPAVIHDFWTGACAALDY